MRPKASHHILAPVREAITLEWEYFEDETPATDGEILTPEDRLALGMTPEAAVARPVRDDGDARRVLRQILP